MTPEGQFRLRYEMRALSMGSRYGYSFGETVLNRPSDLAFNLIRTPDVLTAAFHRGGEGGYWVVREVRSSRLPAP